MTLPSHLLYLEQKPFNVNAHETNNEKLSHENEIAEYFIQFRHDELLESFTSKDIKIDIDEDPIIKKILFETKEKFRNVLREGVTDAILLVNFDRDDNINLTTNKKKLRNILKINFEVPINVDMGELTATDYEGEIVTFEAQVAHWSKKTSITISAVYKCPICEYTQTRPFIGKVVPDKCELDNKFLEFFKPSISEDFRRIVLREITNNFTRNNLPTTITADVYGKTVGEMELSDKIIVTGIFRSIPLKLQDGKISQEFIPTIQIISIQNMNVDKIEFPSMELMKKFKDLEFEGKLVKEVTKGFAYNIYKKEMEKQALICSILGSKWIGATGNGNPPMIHVLFVGDPDTYKSTLMKYVTNIFDNCVLADSTTVSNAGIKAIAVKMDDGRMSITAGLLPTHNEGIVYLDEFGDMKPDIYADLKAPMIDGRVSKHVAGEDFNGIAETAIWASMNPTEGVWDTKKTILENLSKLGKPLITRFDILFLFSIDFINEYESMIEQHMDTCDNIEGGKPEDILTDHEIKLFLNYARTIDPKVTPDALARKNEFFAGIKLKSEDKRSVEQRTKNAVMKFAVAFAKWHMSTVVSAQHVDEAIELYKASLLTFGMVFENGEFINERSLKRTEDGRKTALKMAYDHLKDITGYAFLDDVIENALGRGVFDSRAQLDTMIKRLEVQGDISHKDGMVKFTWK